MLRLFHPARYLFGAGVSQLVYGISVALQWTVAAPFVLLCSRWLWKRCGHHYIFIIGLLLYSIRFLGIVNIDSVSHLFA